MSLCRTAVETRRELLQLLQQQPQQPHGKFHNYCWIDALLIVVPLLMYVRFIFCSLSAATSIEEFAQLAPESVGFVLISLETMARNGDNRAAFSLGYKNLKCTLREFIPKNKFLARLRRMLPGSDTTVSGSARAQREKKDQVEAAATHALRDVKQLKNVYKEGLALLHARVVANAAPVRHVGVNGAQQPQISDLESSATSPELRAEKPHSV